MIKSKNNIILKIEDNKYAILNPISGSFDIMDNEEKESYDKLNSNSSQEFIDYLLERGYIFSSKENEEIQIQKSYKEFNEEVNNSNVQLMLVLTYGCNLACTYCFQHGIDNEIKLITPEVVDAFFDYAKSEFKNKGKKPFITLFGGEPLINSKNQKDIIKYILNKINLENYELSIVTNGYDLAEYIDMLKIVPIKEIQVTLDGSSEIHDSRRNTSNKKGTFSKIISGIQMAIAANMPINLRSVVDLENIEDLVNLANFLDKKGWLDLPPNKFKTQIGRNYELFDCYAKPQHLMTQFELWEKYSQLSLSNPILKKFHRPDFKGIRHIIDTGEMYMASFDTCPACKTEWVFDLYGDIYGCTASCGRTEYLLGNYYPNISLNNDAINSWKKRDVLNIPECIDCNLNVICGGGCGVIAANKTTNVLSPDCRPIDKILEVGLQYYKDDIEKIMNDDEQSSCCQEAPIENTSCCSSPKKDNISKGTNNDYTSGCIICGNKLIYKVSKVEMTCIKCKRVTLSNVSCSSNHYICDNCHKGDILTIVRDYLINTNETNPIEIAQNIFKLPTLKMNGPEYHSIVPSIIVTAFQNKNNIKNVKAIDEAINRGNYIKGGFCGSYGNCGAAVGIGIAVSIIETASPMSSKERSNANRATGHALLDISKYIAPRCCKREAMTSIISIIKNFDYFEKSDIKTYTCTQSDFNKDCIKNNCEFYQTTS